MVGWLVGCFGLNGPLRQYFSLYRAVSQREGERKHINIKTVFIIYRDMHENKTTSMHADTRREKEFRYPVWFKRHCVFLGLSKSIMRMSLKGEFERLQDCL